MRRLPELQSRAEFQQQKDDDMKKVTGVAAVVAALFMAMMVASVGMLQGCSPAQIAEGPANTANATVLDEKAVLGAELAYKAMRTAGTLAVDHGLLVGADAAKVAAIDSKAYAALKLARQAYEAGNAADYATATAQALQLIGEAQLVISGGG